MFRVSTMASVWPIVILLLPLAEAQCSGTTTISTSAQATGLADCSTYDGDVDITDIGGEISIDGISEITGDLTASVVNDMTGLSASRLLTVGGRLRIQYADELATLSLPALRDIGTLSLQDLPKLASIDAGSEGWQNVTSITIRRTGLGDLGWLRSQRIEDLTIKENLNLTDLTLSGLSVAESFIAVEENSPVSLSFPDLELAYNISVQGCTAVSLPLLSQVNRSISFIDNSFEELKLPSVLTIDGSFMLWNNSALSSVSVPILANVSDDIVISHNPKLGRLSFPELGIVEGDISANGSFSEFGMPSLTDVQGDVVIRSTVPLNCTSLEAYNQQHVLKARYICESGTGEPLDTSSSSDSSLSDGGGGGLSTSAKAGVAVGVVAGVGFVVLGLFFYWRGTQKSRASHDFRQTAVVSEGKERYRTPGDLAATSHGKEQYSKAELSAEFVQKTAPELHGDSRTGLMGKAEHNGNAAELDGTEVRTELSVGSPDRN